MPVPGGVSHYVQAHVVPRMIAQTPMVTSFLTSEQKISGETAVTDWPYPGAGAGNVTGAPADRISTR